MGDIVLGLTLSEVLDTSLRIAGILVNDLRNAPVDLSNYIRELDSLRLVLQEIMESLASEADDSVTALLRTTLTGCLQALRAAFDIIGPMQGKTSLRQRIRWISNKDRFAEIMRRVEREKATLQMAVTTYSSHRMGVSMRYITEMNEFERLRFMSEQAMNVLNWLSPYDFSARRSDIQARRLEGIGNWIKDRPEFLSWLNGHVQLLWLEGKIGTGKSYLFSHILDFLEHELDEGTCLAYFYLNSQDFQASGLATVLRSILRQLSAPLHGLPIPVQEIWDTFGKEGRAPTIDVLRHALTAVIHDLGEVRICFDGVDQLPWESVLQLAELIRGFDNQSNVRLLVTSRPFRFDEFKYLVHKKVDFEAHPSDLESYVDWRLSRSVRLQSFPLLRENVLSKVLDSAGGMFLAVALQMDMILKKSSPKKLLASLETTSPVLFSIYDDILNQILKEDLAPTVLNLLIRASRPLELGVLQQGVTICQGEDASDPESLVDLTAIIRCCADFISIDAFNFISFAHWTIRQFLGPQIGPVLANQLALEETFPGAFGIAPSENFMDSIPVNSPADQDESEAFYGDDSFSQFSTDNTLVDSASSSDPTGGPKSGNMAFASIPEQIVRLFLTDTEIEALVCQTLDSLGTTGFERAMSALLKSYSKDLAQISEKSSQTIVAAVVGRRRRYTASLLRSAVRPQDGLDHQRNQSTLKRDRGKDLILDRFLHDQDVAEVTQRSAPVGSNIDLQNQAIDRSAITRETASDLSDDDDVEIVHTNLSKAKEFLIGSPPFLNLKKGLKIQMHGGEPLPIPELDPDVASISTKPTGFRAHMIKDLILSYITSFWLHPFRSLLSSQGRRYFEIVFSLIAFPALSITMDHQAVQFDTQTWLSFLIFGITAYWGLFHSHYFGILPQGVLTGKLARMLGLAITEDDQAEPRMDETRFSWTCQCGETFNETVSELRPGVAEEWVMAMTDGGNRASSSADPTTLPKSPPKAYIRGSKGSDQSTDGKPIGNPTPVASAKTMLDKGKTPERVRDYVLLCINQGGEETKLVHKDLSGNWTDQEAFRSISEEYNLHKNTWWRLTTLARVEFKKFQLYHSIYVNVDEADKEEIPICEAKCNVGCGNGCVEYWYTPLKGQIPPVPRKTLRHLLRKPEHFGNKRLNRDALPRRRQSLELGPLLPYKTGWGLNFVEKVDETPIRIVHLASIMLGTVFFIIWGSTKAPKIGTVLSGPAVIGLGQSVVALMQKWGESNLGATSEKKRATDG